MPAETLVIFGESGAGKSTLINVIADCVPFSGSVLRSSELDLHSIGISYDSFATFAELRVRDIVEMYSRLRRVQPNYAMAEQLRLDEIGGRRFRALSAGERKRLALYAALFFDPLLAILDEPTDGLDPMQRRIFWRLVEKRRGATVIVTHLWEEALRSHDRICLLAAGRMVGEPRSLGDGWQRYRREVDLHGRSLPPVPVRRVRSASRGWKRTVTHTCTTRTSKVGTRRSKWPNATQWRIRSRW